MAACMTTSSPCSAASRAHRVRAEGHAGGAGLGALAPRVDVASSSAPAGLVWQHLARTVDPHAQPALATVSPPPELRRLGAEALLAAGWRGQGPLAIVHPGAGGEGKRWPAP